MEYIYNKFQSRMITYAESILHNYHDAEDAVQIAFSTVAKRIEHIEDVNSPLTEMYIYTIVRNSACDIYQSNKKRIPYINFDEIHHVASPTNIAVEYEINDTAQRLHQYIKNMDSTYRDVLSLYYLHRCKPSHIATLLNRPVATVKSQIQRGTAMIEMFFKEEV